MSWRCCSATRPDGRPIQATSFIARLLERAANLSAERGGGSLTALPIAETQAGNLSAYIQTNLISITDGQFYLDAKLFHEGQKPAVDVGRSISRVGGKTQPPPLRELSASLRLDHTQFLELEVFTRFGGMVDARTRKTIEHGRRIRAVLSQDQYQPQPLAMQIALLLALPEGVLDQLAPEHVAELKTKLPEWLAEHAAAAVHRISTIVGTWRPGCLELYVDAWSRAPSTAAATDPSALFGIYRWAGASRRPRTTRPAWCSWRT